MIGSCNCPITDNCPITQSDCNFEDKLEQNAAVYAPITFEEIVIDEKKKTAATPVIIIMMIKQKKHPIRPKLDL